MKFCILLFKLNLWNLVCDLGYSTSLLEPGMCQVLGGHTGLLHSSRQRADSSPGLPSAQASHSESEPCLWLNTPQIHILRLYAGLLQRLTTWSPACLLTHHQSVCYRRDDFSVDHSDHCTVQLKFLWNLTQLLIKAPSSLRGYLLPASVLSAHCLPTATAVQTIGCLLRDVALCLPPSAWAHGVLSAKLRPLVLSFGSSAPLKIVSLQYTSSIYAS